MKYVIEVEVNDQTKQISALTNILTILSGQIARIYAERSASDFLDATMTIVNEHPAWIISEAGPEADEGVCVMRMMLTSAPFQSETRQVDEVQHIRADISTCETKLCDPPKRH